MAVDVCVVGVVYTEGQPDTYQGVRVTYQEHGERKQAVFATGDFQADIAAASQWAGQNFAHVCCSSSLDHFMEETGFAFAEQ